ncbi:MAG: glycosyltransferase family 2 protein [Candidatus Omnitrophica bacterium]|nr:glycosyltransferase family 2 protein [Candidatus Omnitrophota bacterium]
MFFWLSVLAIIYTYVGYPLLIFIISLFYEKPVKKKYIYPTVSVIMSVHNEEKNIKQKLESLINLDYPNERFEILLGSDGSTDKSNEIIQQVVNDMSDRHTSNKEYIRVYTYFKDRRQGKPSMLNELAKQAKGEILVFTDARQRLDKNSLKELVKNFSDAKVGSVSAELHFEGENTSAGNGIGVYWRYEKYIRKAESRAGSMLGATGALYAIRRELFEALPINLILDDVYIPMRIVQKGYRAIFDKKAKIYDRYPKNAKEEFLRKVRTLAGNFQIFVHMRWLLNPFKSPVAWQMFSHKFLRLMVPFLLIFVLVCSFYLRSSVFLSDGFYSASHIL